MERRDAQAAFAHVGGWLATDLVDVTADLAALDGGGWWAVVLPYDAQPVLARFARLTRTVQLPATGWLGADAQAWTSSLDMLAYARQVRSIHDAIAAGDVYQVNLTRRLSAPLPADADIAALGAALAQRHPSPHGATIRVPAAGVHIASASPELFLRRDGATIESRPIKGTAAEPNAFLAKDRAENVMIVDLVRNDLGRVCDVGTVTVPGLCDVEHHPGLVHLVSTVRGRLRAGLGWPDILDASFPPGSVTGAPKVSATRLIRALEPVPRGVYCGAVGWVDADRRRGELNVAIRTFWFDDRQVHLGTGGAITWDSDATSEWAETELKARRLLAVASDAPIGVR